MKGGWNDVAPDSVAAPLADFIQSEPFLNGLLVLRLLRHGHAVWVRQRCMDRIMEHLQSKPSEPGWSTSRAGLHRRGLGWDGPGCLHDSGRSD